MSYLLIFDKMKEILDQDRSTVTDETKLPHGLAFPYSNWKSFVLAFARIYSLVESKSPDETLQFFGIKDDEWDGTGTFSDNGNLHTDILADPDLLEISWQKANTISKALEKEKKKKSDQKTRGKTFGIKKPDDQDIYTESEYSDSDGFDELPSTDEENKKKEADKMNSTTASGSKSPTKKQKVAEKKKKVKERRPFPPSHP